MYQWNKSHNDMGEEQSSRKNEDYVRSVKELVNLYDSEESDKESDTSSLSEYSSDTNSEDDDSCRAIKRSLKDQENNFRNKRAKFESSKNNESK